MLTKLDAIRDRYLELSEAISQPETINDYPNYQKYLKERAALEETVKYYDQYLQTVRHLDEAKELLADPDMAEAAENEIHDLSEHKAFLWNKLKLLLVPPDPMDSRNVVMEIRSGAGGEEAALFAGDLLRMYLKYCDRGNLKASVISLSDTDLGGINEALMIITGTDAYARMKFESGVHCVKRIPITESGGRIHTSTATVAVFPEADDVELSIDPSELRIDVFHATGHGGQGVNTTDSAVRITHIPTGTVVTCQDERSQLENKAKAMKVLRSRLLDTARKEQLAAHAADRKIQIRTGDRSERIRTYYFNHDYVVDHRLGLTVPRTGNTMDGDLDPFIEALRLAEKTEKLKSLHS